MRLHKWSTYSNEEAEDSLNIVVYILQDALTIGLNKQYQGTCSSMIYIIFAKRTSKKWELTKLSKFCSHTYKQNEVPLQNTFNMSSQVAFWLKWKPTLNPSSSKQFTYHNVPTVWAYTCVSRQNLGCRPILADTISEGRQVNKLQISGSSMKRTFKSFS